MTGLQKAGAWSSLVIAATYIFGFGLFFAVLDRSGYDGPAGNVAFVLDHQASIAAAMIALYVVAGCALVILAIAMHSRLVSHQPEWMGVTTAFGLIWAGIVIASGFVGLIGMQAIAEFAQASPDHAPSAWLAISVVQDALGGGIELVGGIWTVLVSWIALRARIFSRALHYLGLAIGLAGIATVIPGLGDLAALFGLTQIVWFIWLAVEMVRSEQRRSTAGA